ncbi:MAG: PAS domain S-box protein [Halobacteriales archaeon]|nr:PAS domain S-box protein [Halobacteriales archaeon]
MIDDVPSADGQIRVLHVDDDPEFLELSVELIADQADDLDVELATRGDEALARVRESAFDCVVSDFDMPGKDGLEFLHDVREEDPELPFILFTGKGSEEIASEAISAGVTDYLQKQGGRDQYALLVNRIRNAVERTALQAELEATLDRYRTLVEQNVAGIYILQEGRWVYANPRARDIVGYSMDELRAMDDATSIVAEEARETVRQNIRKRIEGELEEIDYTLTIVRGDDGERRHVRVHGRRIEYGGEPAIMGTVVDVSDLRQRERELEQATNRYRALLENANDAIARVDFEGETPVIVEYNDTFEALFVPRGTDAVGRDIDEIVAGDARREDAREISRRVRAGESIQGRLTRDTVDGPQEFLWQAIPIESAAEGPTESGFAIYTPLTVDEPIE